MGLISFFNSLRKKPPLLKTGLALGSGGAKGMAHLGALKAFEEEHIRFDMVSGTSIGSIIGAMYAKGYSATDMYELIKALCLKEYVKISGFRMSMEPIESMLDDYLGDAEFSDLKIPFVCWATDENTNDGVLLNKGKVSKACTASSAMPPFFNGVNIDGRTLVDGAFTNSVPADALKDMGAGFIVGIDLSASKYSGGGFISSVIDKLPVKLKVETKPDAKERGYLNSDVMLTPNLRQFRATELSFSSWDRMYEEGYTEAMLKMPEIKSLLKKAGYVFGK